MFDLVRVTSAPAAVNQNDKGVLDSWQKSRLLPILPMAELGGIRYVETVKKRSDLE
jgi:hypothetical protein